jgi:ATP-dependent DNA helicase RecG
MTEAPAALAALLTALGPPLEFLAADEFRHAERTRLPLGAITERLAAARQGEDDAERTAALDELAALLRALAEAAGADRVALLRRAHALLVRLRGGGPTAGVREPEYGGPGGDVAPALAALAAPIAQVPGVGPKRAHELERFGLTSVEDLLYHVPFRYEDRRIVSRIRDLVVGTTASTEGEVAHVRQAVAGRGRRHVLEVALRDGADVVLLVWFHQVGYFAQRFAVGERLLVHGRVEPPLGNGPSRMVHPDVAALGRDDADGRAAIVPVYEKPTGMPVGLMRRLVHAALDAVGERVPAALPPEVARRQRVIAPARALRYLHQPPNDATLEALTAARSLAHVSLAFDELFFLQLGLALRRSAAARTSGTAFPPTARLGPGLRRALPFALTAAQERAVAEIAADLEAPHPMRRLLQGDVGSGKTLVALLAALTVVEHGAQAAFMAPTELLAEQHRDTIAPLVAPLGVRVELLTGAVRGAARRAVLRDVGGGTVGIVVGTQALIQEGVGFGNLGLAIVDEQHRFGVLQRAALQRRDGRGEALDVLVMSATPIPRTLALTLYGDLAVSTIDALPPGRTPIATTVHRAARRDVVHDRLRAEVAAGHQAYVVYPLVEESEKSALRAATQMVRELAAGPLAGLRLDVLHGRMKPDEKDRVMRRFKAHEFDVLVSTTVIEVGIDVPNATIIVIEHAERFGLAQLHQLRGRVGRGRAPGRCELVAPDWMHEDTFRRLRVLESTTDGFRIAEADLELRGPGDFLGTRQAGLPPFRVANLVRDTALLRAARDEAAAWLAHDPDLARPESATLRAVLAHRWAGRLELARVG